MMCSPLKFSELFCPYTIWFPEHRTTAIPLPEGLILYLLSMKPSKLAQAVVFLTYIQKVYGLNCHHNTDILTKAYAYFSSVLSGTCWVYFLPASLDIKNHHSIPHTATPQLMTIPLTTNWSYDQNFLKKISFHATRKMSLTFHSELHFYTALKKLCSCYFATKRLLIWIPLNLPNGVYATSFCIFDLRPIQLKNRCSAHTCLQFREYL